MARKGQTDPNAPIPGERRGLRGRAPDTAQNAALDDGEQTRAEPMIGDATQAQPMGMFDVPTRGGGMPFEQTPIEPLDVSDDQISAIEPSKVAPPPAMDFDATMDDEPIERTTIDSSLLEQLAKTESVGDKTTSLLPKDRESGRGPKPVKNRATLDDVASATADLSGLVNKSAAPFEKMESGGASNPNDKPGSTMILEGGEHRKQLEAARLARQGSQSSSEPIPVSKSEHSTDEFGELPPAEPPSEMPTSARPLSSSSYSGEGPAPQIAKQAGSITNDLSSKEDDGWSDYQEPNDDWGRSDSVSAVKPKKQQASESHTPVISTDSAVFEKPSREPPKAIVKLIAIEGDDVGEIDIPGEDVVFGREADCPVVLKDPSISRKHARLTRVENGWELVDLRSGNGTFVNGKRVDQAIVRHNDEIKLGSASFRFVDPSEGMLPVDASAAPVLAASNRLSLFTQMRENPRLRTIVVGASLLSVFLLGTLAVLAYQRGGGSKGKTEVFQLYLQGVEQFKQHRWVPAEGFFAAALQRDHEHQRSRRYLEAIAVEKRAEQALATAKARLGNGDLAGAYENAIQASDSVFFGADAQAIINTVDRLADERLAKAKSALAGDDKQAARNLLEGLDFYSSYRGDLNELRHQAELKPVASRSTNILTQSLPPTAASPNVTKTPTAEALDALADARIDEATMKLKAMSDNKEAADLIDRIGKFKQQYEDGKSELTLKRPDNAIKSLTLAVTTLEHMTGQRGDLDKRVRSSLADALYLRAVTEFNDGKVAEAEKTAKLATSYTANHENSVNLLTKIQAGKK